MREPTADEWLEAFKPEWAERLAGEELEINLQLCTRDGRAIGNAVIACQVTESHGTYWAVLTDAGNVVKMTDEEIDERFYRGEYIMKARDVEARYAKATGIPHV
ncbi:hypothetical protein JT354_gp37 [Serratia phage JS26]|uniref:Uncharacterized protein n=1 Tax=Serratia phage JS26 TaxID=2315217 RepID=A0A5Q2F6K8_9CAUD|nr:hypothetical protein JT354_gp37 [Serratia phage JS26]QGF20918.1 hypothetical protein [Serratia phage JS26]